MDCPPEDHNLERIRLEPFIRFHEFATGHLNSDVNLTNYINRNNLVNDVNVDWDDNSFANGREDEIILNTDWIDVDELNLQYAKVTNDHDKALFEGSEHKASDFARYILHFKSQNLKLGDFMTAELVGIMASFLPRGDYFLF